MGFNKAMQILYVRHRKISLLILLVICSHGHSQYNDDKFINSSVDFFRKPPTEASLSKMIDIPAGNYTGVANFSIPIYTIEIDGMEFPIELNYHTTGIKVDEIASRVGLGWSLNTGGIHLSRQVYGTPDYEYGYRPIIKEIPEGINPDGTITGDNVISLDPFDIEKILLDLNGLGLSAELIDINPDVYSYSLYNSSGKFIMDSDGNGVIPMPYTKSIKSNMDNFGNIGSLSDDQGNTYFFKRKSVNDFRNLNCVPTEPTPIYIPLETQFDVASIMTNKNNRVDFSYNKTVNTTFVTSKTESKRIYLYKSNEFHDSPMASPPICNNYTQLTENILTKIDFPDGSVEFIYNDQVDSNSSRLDLIGDYYVKKIIVKNYLGEIIKTAEMFYSYFISPDNGGLTGYNYYNGIDKRLKLDSVIINNIETYKLEYYDDVPLPHRLSNAQDYWGVYNGKHENKTTIPTTKYILPGSTDHKVFLGGDKNPDFNYGKMGNLKKITYPTGGYTLIEYEPDEFNTKNIYPPIYNYDKLTVLDISIQNTTIPVEGTFTIPIDTYNQRVFFKGNEEMEFTHGKCYAEIYKKNTQGVFELLPPPNKYYSTNYTLDNEGEPQGGLGRNDDPGEYMFRLYPDLDPDLECSVKYQFIQENLLDSSTNRKIGTLRVKKIEAFNESGKQIIRNFKYVEPGTTLSSGKNFGPYHFNAIKFTNGPLDNTFGHFYEELKLVNNPGWNLSTAQGKSIGYKYVQEIFTSIDNSDPKEYKIEYTFKNDDLTSDDEDDDIGDPFNDYYPYRVFNNTWPVNGSLRGLKLREDYYDSQGVQNKSIIYKYDYDVFYNSLSSSQPVGTNIVAHGINSSIKSKACDNFSVCNYIYNIFLFPIRNHWIKNVKVTTTEYDSNEDPTIVITDSMQYSPDYKHTFLSAKITENSIGETIRTEYYYPEDLTAYYEQSSMMNKLVERNMIASPVITKTFVDQTPVTEQRTHYFHFHENDSSGGFILPQYVFAKKGEIGATSSAEDKKITYDYYDEKGNLTEYTLADGTPVSIIWGYDKQYPIAKVEGVRNNQITNHILTLESLSNNGTLVPGSFESLRNLTGALVTCYIYEPLVGVTTIIQPNGEKEYYGYDDAGRLKEIYIMDDGVKKILRTIDYNYQH